MRDVDKSLLRLNIAYEWESRGLTIHRLKLTMLSIKDVNRVLNKESIGRPRGAGKGADRDNSAEARVDCSYMTRYGRSSDGAK